MFITAIAYWLIQIAKRDFAVWKRLAVCKFCRRPCSDFMVLVCNSVFLCQRRHLRFKKATSRVSSTSESFGSFRNHCTVWGVIAIAQTNHYRSRWVGCGDPFSRSRVSLGSQARRLSQIRRTGDSWGQPRSCFLKQGRFLITRCEGAKRLQQFRLVP